MNAMIAKAKTATTDQLLEMATLLASATTREALMSRMAVMVALESRMSPVEFDAFSTALEEAGQGRQAV